jgi:membrane-associated protease RseP (regulator of RpoE activity)
MKDPLEEASVDVSRGIAARVLLAVLLGLVALAVLVPGARTPLAIIAGLILLIMLHEAGHYWAAKRTGMKVTEFFVGFGPRLWSFRRGETEYGVKAVPAGGYVRILGMNNTEDVDADDEPRTYRAARYRDRLVVVLAGVTVNIIIAFCCFGAVILGNGVADGPSTTVARVELDSAAHVAGLQAGDTVVAIDGAPVEDWEHLVGAVQARPDQAATVTIERSGSTVDVEAVIGSENGQGFLGIGPTTRYSSVGVLEAVPKSFDALWDVTAGTGTALGRFFSPEGVSDYTKNFTSAAPEAGSTEDLERPRSIIGIVDQGSDIVGGDFWAFLWLLGGISLILALFNLVPLPPFDGGHAAVVVYEWAASKITGRRVEVDYRKLVPVAAIVLAFFLTLSLSAMFLDVRQTIGQ